MRFALPPRFASVVRALGALEGAVLAVDPQFEVVTAAPTLMSLELCWLIGMLELGRRFGD